MGVVDAMPLDEVLALAVNRYEREIGIPDYYMYADWSEPFRPPDLFDALITEATLRGLDTLFGAVEEFAHFWRMTEDRGIVEVDSSFAPREARSPLWKARYGLGTVVRASILREGSLTGGAIGIMEIAANDFSGGRD